MSQDIKDPSGKVLYCIYDDILGRRDVILPDGTLVGYLKDGKTFLVNDKVIDLAENPDLVYKNYLKSLEEKEKEKIKEKK